MRQHSKALAIASNYKAVSNIQSGSSPRSPVTLNVPTVRDGIDVATLLLPAIPGSGLTFDLQALTIVTQMGSPASFTFKLFQKGTPDVDLSGQVQVTLPANTTEIDSAGDPLHGGLARGNTYFLRCESSDPEAYIQGVTVVYTIGGF